MAGMTDFEEGKLVNAVNQLHKDVSNLTGVVNRLNDRLAKQEVQLAKGKGMAAGAMMLAAVLGGISSYLIGEIK